MTPSLQRAPVEFPPGYDGRTLLLPTRHGAWSATGETGAGYRRYITKPSPLLFAVTYFPHLLRQSDTGVMSFSVMHLDLCRSAAKWPGSQGQRDAWVGPREIGKSAWLFVVLPAWALAHRHRGYFLAFSFSDPMASGQLANLMEELRENELLRHDFPDLAPRRGSAGGRTKLAGGASIAAKGMGGTLLGTRARETRPDLIVGDDLQPGEVDNSPDMVRKNESRLRRNILPMNTRATVQVTGTVTMRDDLIHPIVHAALGRPGAPSWVAQERFQAHYYPALQPDGTSLWPQRWPVAELERMRTADPRGFALNYMNDPGDDSEATWWTPDLFRYDEAFPTVERVIHVDVATTRRAGSDFTVLAQVGRDRAGLRACVERVEWGRWDLAMTRARIHEFCAPLRRKPLVRIEGNQGGDTWLDSLAPWPEGVRHEVVHARAPKRVRISRAHSHYTRRAVVHAWEMPELEAQLCGWTPAGTAHDDVPDACGRRARVGVQLSLHPRNRTARAPSN
jgi:hypothetical protein